MTHQRNNYKKRGIACLIAAVLILGMLPLNVFASDVEGDVPESDVEMVLPTESAPEIKDEVSQSNPEIVLPTESAPETKGEVSEPDVDVPPPVLVEDITTRAPMDLSDVVFGDSQTTTQLFLGDREILDGDTIDQSDLIGSTLRASFQFNLPLGQTEYDGDGNVVYSGAPMPGDVIRFPLPEVFSMVSPEGDGAAHDIDFTVSDVNTGSITIGSAHWDTDAGAIILTFNDEMADQNRWIALDGCWLSAQVWYSERPGSGDSGDETITFFDKTFTVEKKDPLVGSYTLSKSVVDEQGNELGQDVVYSKSGSGAKDNYQKVDSAAITEDGIVTWKVTVAALGDATLDGVTIRGLLSAAESGKVQSASRQAVLSVSLDGVLLEGDALAEVITSGAFTFQADGAPITGVHTFLIRTQIDAPFWRTQPGSNWTWGRKVMNTAELWSAEGADTPSRMLLSAAASVSFVPRLLVKQHSGNTLNQTWTVRCNDAGHAIQGAYLVDTLSNVELSGENPITISGTALTENTTPEQVDAKAAGTYTVKGNVITVYLGDITGPVVVTLHTQTTQAALNSGAYTTRNTAQLFGMLDGNPAYSYGNDWINGSSVGAPAVIKTGTYQKATDKIQWKTTAQANLTTWRDAFLCDFIVPGGDQLSLTAEQWDAFAADAGLTAQQLQAVQGFYTANPGHVAAWQSLTNDPITFQLTSGANGSAGTVNSGAILGEDGIAAYYVVGHISPTTSGGAMNIYNAVLSFSTTPSRGVPGAPTSAWTNYAALYQGGQPVRFGRGNVSVESDGSYLKKALERYDYETHTATWGVTLNPKQLRWDLYLNGDVTVTDYLPEGWSLVAVTFRNQQVETSVDDETGAVSWSIPAEFRTGTSSLLYLIIATLDDPETYLQSGSVEVANRASLLLDGVDKGADSCDFTLQNRQPGKSAASTADKSITWSIQVNEAYVPYTSAYVEDKLPDGLVPVGTVEDGRLTPTVRAYYLDHAADGTLQKGAVAPGVTASYNSQTGTVRIALPEPGKGYWLEFTTTIYGPVANSYQNTAKFVANGQGTNSGEASMSKQEIQGAGKSEQVGSITVRKTSEDGRLLSGAVFRLTSTTNPTLIREATAKNGVVSFPYVPYDTYRLEEILPAPGFVVNEDFNAAWRSFRLEGAGTTLNMTMDCKNQSADYTVAFTKVDGMTGQALEGVGFSLFPTQTPVGDPAHTAVSDAYGYVSFPALQAGTYFLFETTPPAGYLSSGRYLLRADISPEGTVSYTRPDGSIYMQDELYNGVSPRIENFKSAIVTVTGLKTLTGRDLAAGEFQFTLTRDSDGEIVSTVSNAASGAFSFTLAFQQPLAGADREHPKTYGYTISEQAGSVTGVTYDKTLYRLAVGVFMENDAVQCTYTLAADGADTALTDSIVTFQNTYNPDPSPSPSESPDPNPPDPNPPGPVPDPNPGYPPDPSPSASPSNPPDVEIPDEDVPEGGIPDEELPSPEVPDVEIPDEDVPEGNLPSDDTIIVDDDVPLGDLPQTGAAVSPASPVLGLTALTLAGFLALTGTHLLRKREEDAD